MTQIEQLPEICCYETDTLTTRPSAQQQCWWCIHRLVFET